MQNSQTAKINNEPDDISWQVKKLGSIAEVVAGFGFPIVYQGKKSGDYPFFKVGDISQEVQAGKVYIGDANNYLNKLDLEKLRAKPYPKGTTVFAKIGEAIKLNRRAILAQDSLIDNNVMGAIPNSSKVTPEFLYYFLRTIQLEEISRSTTVPSIRKGDVEDIDVPTPTLDVQNKVVAKLSAFLQWVESSNKSIKQSRKLIQRFRQSVLSAAVTGKLTEKWREKNQDYKSADEILKQIKEQRLATGNNKNKLQDIYTYEEQSDNDELPDKWGFVSLDKLCNSFNYGTSTKSQTQGKVPVLRMGNLQKGEIDWNNLVFTSDDNEIEKYSLRTGDILFNRTNSPELVGKTSIYRGERPAIFAGYLIKINNPPQLNSEYLNYCLNSSYAKDYCYQVKSDGVSQSNINAQKLGKFEVPFCSTEEQQEIVKRIKSMFEVADLVDKQIKMAGSKADKLTQSILAKAFRGELI